VRAPDGSRWRVGKRWIERRPPRLHKRLSGGLDGGEKGSLIWDGANIADAIGSIWGAGGLIVFAVVVIVVVLPILGLAIELVLLLLFLFFGLVARLCFGRPWIVEAAPIGAGRDHEERETVVRRPSGWRASGEAIAQMRNEIEVSGRPAAAEVDRAV
jgi:hypothetical protein